MCVVGAVVSLRTSFFFALSEKANNKKPFGGVYLANRIENCYSLFLLRGFYSFFLDKITFL